MQWEVKSCTCAVISPICNVIVTKLQNMFRSYSPPPHWRHCVLFLCVGNAPFHKRSILQQKSLHATALTWFIIIYLLTF